MPEQAVLELVVKDQGSAAAATLEIHLKNVGEAAEHAEHSLLELDAARDLLERGFDALKEIGESLIDKFEEFENVAKVFQLKDGERGNEVLEEMLSRMKDVGISATDAIGIAKKLGTEFDPKSAEELSAVVSDVRGNLRLTSQETQGLANEFVKLGARATVGAKNVRAMDWFFGGKNAVEEIAKATGKSIDLVTQQLKKSMLPTDQLVKGLRLAQLELAGTGTAGAAAQKAASTSVTDQVGRLKNIVGDFGETLAKDLFGGNDAAEGIRNFADKLKELLESKDVQGILMGIATTMKDVGHVAGVLVVGAIDLLTASFRGVKSAYAFLTGPSEKAHLLLAGLAGAITTGLIVALVALVPPLVAAGIAAAGAAIGFIAAAAPILVFVAAGAALAVLAYEVYENWGLIKKGLGELGAAIVGFVSGAWSTVVGAVSSGWQSIKDVFSGVGSSMLQVGKDLVNGLVNGIRIDGQRAHRRGQAPRRGRQRRVQDSARHQEPQRGDDGGRDQRREGRRAGDRAGHTGGRGCVPRAGHSHLWPDVTGHTWVNGWVRSRAGGHLGRGARLLRPDHQPRGPRRRRPVAGRPGDEDQGRDEPCGAVDLHRDAGAGMITHSEAIDHAHPILMPAAVYEVLTSLFHNDSFTSALWAVGTSVCTWAVIRLLGKTRFFRKDAE